MQPHELESYLSGLLLPIQLTELLGVRCLCGAIDEGCFVEPQLWFKKFKSVKDVAQMHECTYTHTAGDTPLQ